MNRKGFTLIELLAVIIIIGILGVLIVPNIIASVEKGKNTSYNILIKNIVTSAQTYYEECEYGDLSDKSKYGSYACTISENTITTTLGTIANTGFLKVNDTKEVNGKEIKLVISPKDGYDLTDCEIKIKKIVTTETDENNIENYRVTYQITSLTEKCPSTAEYEE